MLIGYVLVAAFPYMLSTYLAVKLFGVGMHSTTRSVIGWVFEGPWLFLLLVGLLARVVQFFRPQRAAEG